ncbi:hypothetical protein WQ54_24785 [Bacillus sp. SA1-12]|uniref:DUF4291 domain-containing protein n=1 Tax=Bacillus sp. SA1-12 TaxID=1455638 RepID=UPI00062714CE|nr:DUF4291 domain-containing protein [Bacillus sp. SA1-12]KKI89580.1 hypothetical protein WQ54_24785 [Bacillus sp. SA1-12]
MKGIGSLTSKATFKIMDRNMKERTILAEYNEQTTRVYQAYNNQIANEALNLGTFGSLFKNDRMTWIKPSFLWMMYRSGWGTKENQERILAIDIKKDGFDTLLRNAVLSKFEQEIHGSIDQWRIMLKHSNVRCQWDPDRDIFGTPQLRKAIQIGISGQYVEIYKNSWITNISDCTSFVKELRMKIEAGHDIQQELPKLEEYKVDKVIRENLGMK